MRFPWSPAFTAGATVAASEATAKNVVFATSIDPGTLYGVESIDQAMVWTQGNARVSRREARAVPAVKRAEDLIAGGLGQLTLQLLDPNSKPVDWTLLSQPEVGVQSTITWTNVIADMMYDSRAWLQITHMGWHGKPAHVVRLDSDTMTVQPELKVYRSETGSGSALVWKPDPHLIRIDSPNAPLLVAGARAIRALGRLEAAALNSAEGVPPSDYFENATEVEPFEDDEEAQEFLDAWAAARRARSTAKIPFGLKYHVNTFSPKDLQLVEAREMAIAEIARLTGIDAEDLGVSTTSRTYFNAQDRRRALLDFTFGPYRRAIEARLSMDDVTPPGYTVRFDTSEFARADDLTTAQTDEVLIRSGVVSSDEARAARGLEVIAGEDPAVTAAFDLAKAAPSLVQNPGLPQLVEQIRALYSGETTPIDQETVA